MGVASSSHASTGPLLPTGEHVKKLSGGSWEVGRMLYEDRDKTQRVGTRVFEAQRPHSAAGRDVGGDAGEDGEAFPVVVKVGWAQLIEKEARAMRLLEANDVRDRALVRHASGMWHSTADGLVGFLAVERFEATLCDVALLPSSPRVAAAAGCAAGDACDAAGAGGAGVGCGAGGAAAEAEAEADAAVAAAAAAAAGGAGSAPSGSRREPVFMSMRQLIVATYRLVGALRTLHLEGGMLHRDVAPANIGIRRRSDPSDVALFDLDSHFSAAVPKKQLPPGLVSPFVTLPLGSTRLRYSSIATHGDGIAHPCDDLEQLGYVMLEIALGGLPWAAAASGPDADEAAVLKAKLACLALIEGDDNLKWLHDYLTVVYAAPTKRTSFDAPHEALLRDLELAIDAHGGET